MSPREATAANCLRGPAAPNVSRLHDLICSADMTDLGMPSAQAQPSSTAHRSINECRESSDRTPPKEITHCSFRPASPLHGTPYNLAFLLRPFQIRRVPTKIGSHWHGGAGLGCPMTVVARLSPLPCTSTHPLDPPPAPCQQEMAHALSGRLLPHLQDNHLTLPLTHICTCNTNQHRHMAVDSAFFALTRQASSVGVNTHRNFSVQHRGHSELGGPAVILAWLQHTTSHHFGIPKRDGRAQRSICPRLTVFRFAIH
jgi:hypothetical protein